MKENAKTRTITVELWAGEETAYFFDVKSDDYGFTWHSNQEFNEYSFGEDLRDTEKFEMIKREASKMANCIQRIHELYFDK